MSFCQEDTKSCTLSHRELKEAYSQNRAEMDEVVLALQEFSSQHDSRKVFYDDLHCPAAAALCRVTLGGAIVFQRCIVDGS